jgi:hypothetical protein
LSFDRHELDAIEAWIPTAKALSGIYYRSVEYRFMDPKEVRRSTEGGSPRLEPAPSFWRSPTASLRRRCLPASGASGGSAQITLDKYPRIVFGVTVSLERVLDLSKRGLPKALTSVRQNCLAADDLVPSMELGDLLRTRSIQGLVFPSAVGRGKDLIVYLEHCPAAALEIHNAAELMKKMRQILRKPK